MGQKIRIFTDGACSGNPGPGGWGAIILSPTGRVKELGGGEARTTNNRMELGAVLEALRLLAGAKRLTTKKIEIFTDSTYVIRGMTAWAFGWEKNGWKTAAGEEVVNRDLWEALRAVVKEKEFLLDWHYVRGHVGTPGNERCDEIAVAFSKLRPIPLFDGSQKDYNVDLAEIPKDTSLPAASKGGKKAVVYLSLIRGEVFRDKDWKSCETRVRGVTGAKYKKVSSAEEEEECLEAWGVTD